MRAVNTLQAGDTLHAGNALQAAQANPQIDQATTMTHPWAEDPPNPARTGEAVALGTAGTRGWSPQMQKAFCNSDASEIPKDQKISDRAPPKARDPNSINNKT